MDGVHDMGGMHGFGSIPYEVNQAPFHEEWERRVFKKIGAYLMRHNVTLVKCFNLIDAAGTFTLSCDELRQAIIRFDLGISDK